MQKLTLVMSSRCGCREAWYQVTLQAHAAQPSKTGLCLNGCCPSHCQLRTNSTARRHQVTTYCKPCSSTSKHKLVCDWVLLHTLPTQRNSTARCHCALSMRHADWYPRKTQYTPKGCTANDLHGQSGKHAVDLHCLPLWCSCQPLLQICRSLVHEGSMSLQHL